MKNIQARPTRKNFEPIHVSFTIETKDELLSLVKRLNLGATLLNEVDKEYNETKEDLYDLFTIIDDIYQKYKS